MTVTEKSSRKLISGTGWANPLTHAFLLENQTQVKVYADDVELVLGVDYSVTNLNDEDGYNVTITNPTSWAPVYWVLSVEPPINQPSPLSLGGQFGAAYEAALDTTTRRLQRVWSETERSVKTAYGAAPQTVPNPEPLKFLAWNAAGDALENTDVSKALNDYGVTAVHTIVPGQSTSIDDTDPQNPVVSFTGTGTGDMLAANNLSDLDDTNAALTNIGAGATFDTTALASAYAPKTAPNHIRTAGYTASGDGGGAIYKKVASEPTHSGKFSITLSDGTSVVWYELNTDAPTTRMFGGGTGDPSTDGVALVKLLNYVAARGLTDAEINIERGTYALTKGRSLPSKNHWKFNGSVLDFTGVSNANLVLTAQNGRAHLACEGSVRGALPALSVNVSRGGFVITFAGPHGLAPNDVFQIYNPTDKSWSDERTSYRAGELCRVMVVIDATNVWVDQGLYEDYAAADVVLSTFDTWSGSIEDLHVIGNGLKTAITYGVVVDFAKDVTLQNVSSAKVSYNTHTINRTIDFRVDGCRGAEDGTADFGGDYGLGVYSSQRGLITNSHFIAARHAIAHGNIDGSVPFRDIHYRYCSARSTLTGQVSWDWHSIGDHCSAEYCTAFNGMNDGVKNMTVRECRLHNVVGETSCYIASNQVGGTTLLTDNKYIVDGNYTLPTVAGIIHLANSTSHSYLRDDKYYDINGVTVRGNGQRSRSIVAIWTANAVYAVSVAITRLDDPNANGTREQVLHAHGGNGAPIAAKYYVLDDVRRLNNGVAYAKYSNGMTAPASCKYPTQQGVRNIAGVSGAAVANGSPTTFRHPYPEPPHLAPTCASRLIGGDVWQPSYAALSETGFTPVVATTDGLNFANTTDGVFSWTASLQRG